VTVKVSGSKGYWVIRCDSQSLTNGSPMINQCLTKGLLGVADTDIISSTWSVCVGECLFMHVYGMCLHSMCVNITIIQTFTLKKDVCICVCVCACVCVCVCV
jgi:hypothetical protein